MDLKDALVAIASVAAVVWTGGLIVRQLYPEVVTTDIISGMEFCMFSALASIFGLILSGGPLVLAAGLFFLYYLRVYIPLWLRLRDLNSPGAPFPDNVTSDDARKAWEETEYQYLLNFSYQLTPYLVVILFPMQLVVALVSVIMLFFGYQGILKHFNLAWSNPVIKQRDQFKLNRMTLEYQRQLWDKQWQVGIGQLLAEIRDRLPLPATPPPVPSSSPPPPPPTPPPPTLPPRGPKR